MIRHRLLPSSRYTLAILLTFTVSATIFLSCHSLSPTNRAPPIFTVTPSEQSYLNRLHHPQHQHHARALDSLFLQFDSNHDGHIDGYELQALEHEGTITEVGHTLMKAFDTDQSGTITHAEMTLAPLTLNMLESHEAVEEEVKAEEKAEADEGADIESAAENAQFLEMSTEVDQSRRFSRRSRSRSTPQSSPELIIAEQAFEGYSPPRVSASAPIEPLTQQLRMPARSENADELEDEEGMDDDSDGVLSEVSSRSRSRTHLTSPPPRVKAKKRGSSPLPVSLFGVPSVADEECVMCVYFVQRIQIGVADKLEKPPTDPSAPPADAAPADPAADTPEGRPTASPAAKTLKIRNTNSQLQKKPGGRGIVRIQAEDIMQKLCAVDRMPLLFNPYCSGFLEPNAINAIRKGIFFNIPTQEVCAQAALCRDDSYLNTNAAVHAVKTSLFLNGQRGICGMLGGAKDRQKARDDLILDVICAAHGAVFGNPPPEHREEEEE